MPTRYTLDVDLKSVVTQEAIENSSKRTEARKVSCPHMTTRLCQIAILPGLCGGTPLCSSPALLQSSSPSCNCMGAIADDESPSQGLAVAGLSYLNRRSIAAHLCLNQTAFVAF